MILFALVLILYAYRLYRIGEWPYMTTEDLIVAFLATRKGRRLMDVIAYQVYAEIRRMR